MRSIKIFTIGLIAAAALVFAGCNQITSEDLGEEGSARSVLNLKGKRVGVDPSTWNEPSSQPFAGLGLGIATINAVTSNGAGTIVAAAGTASATYAATSSNGGANWTNQSQAVAPVALLRNPSAANYFGGNYLITAGNRVTAGGYSKNSTTWVATGTIGFGSKASAYGTDANGYTYYVVGGQAGQAAYTADLGAAFTTIPASVTGWTTGTGSAQYINAGAYGQGSTGKPLFVFGGGSARLAYTDTISVRGPNWRTGDYSDPSNPVFTGSDFINVIVFGNGTFVAVGGPDGGQGKAAWSTDGITWTAGDNFLIGDETSVYALAYGGDYFVAGDDEGYITYSDDGGQSWSEPILVFPSGSDPINALTYDGTRFIAVGGATSPMVAYSD
jgi:hypothetical protein